MGTLSYGGKSYIVDHAAKGADFIHGYDANGTLIVAFDGITNFSGFTYSGTYLDPKHCLAEGCNDVKYVDGELRTRDGTQITQIGDSMPKSGGTFTGDVTEYLADGYSQLSDGTVIKGTTTDLLVSELISYYTNHQDAAATDIARVLAELKEEDLAL